MGILSVSNYSILPSIAGGLGVSFIVCLLKIPRPKAGDCFKDEVQI